MWQMAEKHWGVVRRDAARRVSTAGDLTIKKKGD
jgi:hypothetical protein